MSKRGNHHLLALLIILFSCSFVFAQNEKKVAYGIFLDNTGSMRSQFDQVTTLGKEVVRHVYQKGPVSIFNFTSPGEKRNPVAVVSSGIEGSQVALESYIDDLYVLGGQTTLLDAIDSMAKELNARINSDKDAFANAVIILITDGEDRVSHLKEKDLIKGLKASGTKVYALGLVQELDQTGGLIVRSKRDKAKDLLKNITNETGGRVVFPESRKLDVDKLVNELLAQPAQK